MDKLIDFFRSLFAAHESMAISTGSYAYSAIHYWQLLLACGFVLVAGILSVIYRLKLERDLAVGSLLAFVQLSVVGYLLTIIFALDSPWPVFAMYTATALFATRLSKRKVRTKGVSIFWPTFLAMFSTCFFVTSLMSGLILQAKPWWEPQYFIPVGGMIAGNAMNALSIALERFFSELHLRRPEVEAGLCLGASPTEASLDMFRIALRAGMINSINALMGVGLVSLPGMMTGQILAGVPPLQAIRYQMAILLVLTAAAALSSFAALHLARRRCFTTGAALVRFGE